MAEEKKETSIGCTIVALILILFIWFGNSGGCFSSSSSEGDDLHGAWAYAQLFVEKDLKSPRSAKFEFGAVSNGSVKYIGNNTYSVKSYVDAQNSFGAMIRTHFSLEIKSIEGGKKWQIVQGINYY